MTTHCDGYTSKFDLRTDYQFAGAVDAADIQCPIVTIKDSR